MKIIDLTHPVIHDMQVYPGDAPPQLSQIHDVNKDGYTDFQLITSMHTGTHIDGMWHMIDSKSFIGDWPLEQFIGSACIIDIHSEKNFTDVQLVKEKSLGCSIILFYTGFGQYFGTKKYLSDYPVVDNTVAELITSLNVKMIGLDSLSPDLPPYPVHKTLLSKGVLIAENLANLHFLLDKPQVKVIALPLKIAADSAPARIVAIPE